MLTPKSKKPKMQINCKQHDISKGLDLGKLKLSIAKKQTSFKSEKEKVATAQPKSIVKFNPKFKFYINVPIKQELLNCKPLTRFQSLLCTANIFSYVGRRNVVYEVLQKLSHGSRAYCMKTRGSALQAFTRKKVFLKKHLWDVKV